MRLFNQLYAYIATIFCCVILPGSFADYDGYVILTHDGPTVQGGTITFRADLVTIDGTKAKGIFDFEWSDNAIRSHDKLVESTTNSTSIWSVSYPTNECPPGEYSVQVVVRIHHTLWFPETTSQHKKFKITSLLNGNMTLIQASKELTDDYVSTVSETEIKIKLREGDAVYLKENASDVSTFWFVDCKYYGLTNDFTFRYNFTKPDTSASVEALVIASFDPPTTPAPPKTPPTPISTTPASNSTVLPSNVTTTSKPVTTASPPTTLKPATVTNSRGFDMANISVPFVCINSSHVSPDPHKTYGYFRKEVKSRAPIRNITVEGTNWIKPWDMLDLNITCHGSPPFFKCLEYHRGNYNVTGNETCENGMKLDTCNFNITHYFLDPTVYTILMILKNNVSEQVYPLTINIYEETVKPQLSVIVVPVSCSLAAVVLVVFGIAYYIQSRARFTIEVADFDFGQNNPEMEYKTFTQRLRDSLNSSVSLGSEKNRMPQYKYGSMNH